MPASSPARPSRFRAGFIPLFSGLLMLGAIWHAYAPSLDHPFQFDDRLFLEDSNVRHGNWEELLLPPVPRALTWLSFLLQFQLTGEAPFWFHLVNLLLHLCNTGLAFLLLREVFRSDPAAGAATWTAAIGAAIFALHPVQVESVAYVYQRSTLLAALFALAATLLWLRYRNVAGAGLGWVLSLLYLTALGCKEYVVLVPLLWWLTDVAAGRGWRARRALWCPLGLMALAFLVLPSWLAVSESVGFFDESQRYLSAQVTVFWRYLGILVGLVPLNLEHDVQPMAAGSAVFWLAAGGIVALAAAAFVIRRRHPGLTLLAALFFLLLLPTSSLIPSPDLAFEHRLYASLLGAAGVAAWTLFRLWEAVAGPGSRIGRLGRSPGIALGVYLLLLIMLVAGLTVWTRRRIQVWSDPIALWTDAQVKSPGKYRPNFNLGVLSMRASPELARSFLLRAIQISPAQPQAYRSLGQLELESGRPDRARGYWETALRLQPSSAETHAALGRLFLAENQYSPARAHLERAFELDPSLLSPYYHLALLELKFGFVNSAIEWAERGLGLYPNESQLWLVLALAVSEQQNWPRAAELFQEALRRDPHLEAARNGLTRAQAHLRD